MGTKNFFSISYVTLRDLKSCDIATTRPRGRLPTFSIRNIPFSVNVAVI